MIDEETPIEVIRDTVYEAVLDNGADYLTALKKVRSEVARGSASFSLLLEEIDAIAQIDTDDQQLALEALDEIRLLFDQRDREGRS